MATLKFHGAIKGEADIIEKHFANFLAWQCVKGDITIKRSTAKFREADAVLVSGTVTGSPLSINTPDIIRCFEDFGTVIVEAQAD